MKHLPKLLSIVILSLICLALLVGAEPARSSPPQLSAQQAENVTDWEWAVSSPTGYTRGAYDPLQQAAIIVSAFQGENQVWQYLPLGDQWVIMGPPEEGEPSPFPRDGYDMARHPISGDLLLFGGHRPDTCSYYYSERISAADTDEYDPPRPGDGCQELNDLWRVNPATGAWEEITPNGTPPAPRAFAAMSPAVFAPKVITDTAQNLIVLTGGYQEEPSSGDYPDQVTLADTWELRYSQAGEYSWAQRGSDDDAARRLAHSLIFLPDHTLANGTPVPPKLVMSLGVRANGADEIELTRQDSYEYDPSSGQWTRLPAPTGLANDDSEAWGHGRGFAGFWYDQAEGVWQTGPTNTSTNSRGFHYFRVYDYQWREILAYYQKGTSGALRSRLRQTAFIPLDNLLYRDSRVYFANQPAPVLMVGGQGYTQDGDGYYSHLDGDDTVYGLARPWILTNPRPDYDESTVDAHQSGPVNRSIGPRMADTIVRLNPDYITRLWPDTEQGWWLDQCLPPVRSWRYGGEGWEGGLDPFPGYDTIPVATYDFFLQELDNALAHAPGRGAYLFGGTASQRIGDECPKANSDSWEIVGLHNELWFTDDGFRWQPVELSGGDAPTPRKNASLVYWYENEQDYLLLFGGEDADGNLLGDTWLFDIEASTWQQMSPTTSPSPRRNAATVYAEHAGEVWLFGGRHIAPDVWTWDGSTWTEKLSAAEAEAFWSGETRDYFEPSAAYLPARETVFLVGRHYLGLDGYYPVEWDGSQYVVGTYQPDDGGSLAGERTELGWNLAVVEYLGDASDGYLVGMGDWGVNLTYKLYPGGKDASPASEPQIELEPAPVDQSTRSVGLASPSQSLAPPKSHQLQPNAIQTPAASRDFGAVRVWADGFVETGGTVEANGNIMVGSVSADQAYVSVTGTLTFPASPGPDDLISIQNASLSLASQNLEFGQGNLSINQTCLVDGDFVGQLPVAGSDVISLQLTQIEARVCLDSGVRAGLYGSGTISLDFMPENANTDVNFSFSLAEDNGQFHWDGDADAQTALNLAGGALQANLTLDDQGLTAVTATLQLPLYDNASISLDNLRVDPQGALSLGNAQGQFPLPDLSLGGTYGFDVHDITATVQTDLDVFELGLVACMDINLPENDAVAVSTSCLIDLTVRDGELTESQLPDFTITVAGRDMTFKTPSLQKLLTAQAGDQPDQPQAGDYRIYAGNVDWTMPAAWGGATMRLKDVEILTVDPYLRIDGGGVDIPINQQFSLANMDERSVAQFNVNSLTVNLETTPARFTARLDSQVILRLGTESQIDTALILDNGSVSFEAVAASFTVQLSGMELELQNISYQDEAFTADAAALTLPPDWGGAQATVTQVRIDAEGLHFDGAGLSLPDQDFGGVLFLRDMQAELVPMASGFEPKKYRLDVTASVEVVADAAVSTRGTLHFFPDGRVVGDIKDFELSLVTFEFGVEDVHFDQDRLRAGRIYVNVPEELESLENFAFSATVTGMEVSADGIELEGGGFHLSFNVGTVAVSGEASFGPDPDQPGDYIVTVDAMIGTPDMDLEGSVTIALLESDMEVRRVFVAIEGSPPNAPTVLIDPNTMFYLYRLEGEMSLSEARRAISVAVEGKSLASIGSYDLLRARADLTAEWHPSQYLEITGTLWLVNQELAEASLLITPRSVWVKGQLGLDNDIVRIMLEVQAAVGLDSDDEFTMMFKSDVEITLKEDAIFTGLPWDDVSFMVGLSVGKHRHDGAKEWGARGYGSVLDYTAWAWVGFSPVGLDAGTGDPDDYYLPIWPDGIYALEAARRTHPQTFAPTMGPELTTDEARYNALAQASGQFSLTTASSLVIIEYLPEGAGFDAPALSLTQPQGTVITPTVWHTNTTHNARYYNLQNPEPGTWGVQAAPGAYVAALGSDPEPVVQEAALSGSQPPYSLSWAVSDDDPVEADGLWIQARRADEDGQYLMVAESLPATGSSSWTPEHLASGTYTVELVLDTGRQTLVEEMGVITWVDETPPQPPQNLVAEPLSKDRLQVRWQAADQDTAGYRIRLDDGTVLERQGRHRTSLTLDGIRPGQQLTVSVAAVDLSDNASPPASLVTTFPSLDLVVEEWEPWANAQEVPMGQRIARIRFRQAVTVTDFVVLDPAGQPLAGSWQALTAGTVSVGAQWTQTAAQGMTALGTYKGLVQGLDANGNPVAQAWRWTVSQEASSDYTVYLPIVVR